MKIKEELEYVGVIIIVLTFIALCIFCVYWGIKALDFKGLWNTIGLLITSPIIFIIMLIFFIIELPFIIIKRIYEFFRYDIPYYIDEFKQRGKRR